jgi:hypothetical protein
LQKFDPKLYPSLAKLDDKVRSLLMSDAAKDWDTPQTEYEVSRIHPIYFIEEYLYIRPGEIDLGSENSGTEPIPFKLNAVQLKVADKICAHFITPKFTRVQALVLKHRKAGISTLIAAFDYWFLRFYENMNAFVIADLSSHTDTIMGMIDIFQQRDACGQGSKNPKCRPVQRIPLPGSKKGLKFKNGSVCEQDTGENSNPGTSSTLNVVHMSENSKWRDPENAETSLLNSIPRQGFAFVIKESTAFGINKYAQDCEEAFAGKSVWEPIFVTWLEMPDCEDVVYAHETIDLDVEEKELMASYPKMTLGHIKFRRRQISVLESAERFKQDFPLNPREPFLITGSNYFNTRAVQERVDEITFFRDWKVQGLDKIREKYPDLMVKFIHHPRGIRAALSHLEDECVTPVMTEFSETLDGSVTRSHNPKGRMQDGIAQVFRDPKPGHKYVLTIDAAEGKKSNQYTSDDSVVEVFDCFSQEQVCEWGGTFDEETTAHYALMIGKSYNNALIVNEMNNKCGGLTWGFLEKSGYKNLFYRESVNGNKRHKEPGWDTKSGIKKEVCGQFKIDFKNGNCLIHSIDLLQEMLYFIDSQAKLGAAEGHKDDRVMSASVALKVISITPNLKKQEKKFDDYEDMAPGSYVSTLTNKRDMIRRYM